MQILGLPPDLPSQLWEKLKHLHVKQIPQVSIAHHALKPTLIRALIGYLFMLNKVRKMQWLRTSTSKYYLTRFRRVRNSGTRWF